MRRQIQGNGVRKWYGDDWIDMQDQLYDALEKGVLSGLGNVILSGCEIAADTISAGHVYIDGRICPFAGATGVTFPTFLIKEESTAKQRPYLDGVQKPIETQHIAIINAVATAQSIEINASGNAQLLRPHIDASGALLGVPKSSSNTETSTNILATSAAVKTNKDLIDTKSSKTPNPWIALIDTTTADYTIDVTNGFVRVTDQGRVEFKGYVIATRHIANVFTGLFQLPLSARSTRDINSHITIQGATLPIGSTMIIASGTGSATVQATGAIDDPVTYYLDDISYVL